MEEFTWISAFFLGLMGAPHCAGMCGGIVGALSLGCQPVAAGMRKDLQQVLVYNLGRISSYTIAGMLVGGLSALATNMVALHNAQLVLKSLAVVFMLFLGLYMGGWWSALTRLERLGGSIWRYIEPLGRRFIPVRNLRSAYVVGAVWGWLPCGLVYTGLIYSTTAGGAVQGGLLMLFFGLGTLPAMLFMGAVGVRLQSLLQQRWLRRLAGGLVIAFACYMAYTLFRR
jgi:sulfite exporter TauE/SafE